MGGLVSRTGCGLGPAALGILCALATAAARGDDLKPARWIDADAAIYLEVTQPAQVLDRAGGASFQKLLGAIPAYGRYLKSEKYRQFRAVVDMISGKLGTTWDRGLRDLAGGGIVLGVEGEPKKAPRLILAVSPGDRAFLERTSKTLLELARKDASDKGRPDPIKTSEHRGVSIYAPEKGAYAIVEGTLVIGDRVETVKTVIDRALGGTKEARPITEDAQFKARRSQLPREALAWSIVRLDRLRAIDPKFTLPEKEKTPPPVSFLFGSWVEAARKASWLAASLTWTEDRIAADLMLPAPEGGYPDSLTGFVPAKGSGAPALVKVPGTIASLSLWRDLSAIWEARTDLLPPQTVQNLANLDTFAGQFFGGRDFGSGVLGSLSSDWRLIVARQDLAAMQPVPDVKYPAFALIVDLKPDDEFAQRLKVAFQSFVGLVNLGAAQSKAPPLELGSETVEGVTIATSRFMPPKPAEGEEKEPVHQRHNFSPSVAQVESHFILSSSTELARNLVKALKAPAKPTDSTLLLEADGGELAKLLEINRNRLVMQNMLEKGQDKSRAEGEVDTLMSVVRYLGHGRLSVQDTPDAARLSLNFALGGP